MPTTTYTPTATWSNTSTRLANGDAADEPGLSAVGRAALDNIAYLTGSNTRTQVSRIQTCTDLAALKAISPSNRRDLDFCVLDTANGERLYKFDAASTATGDDFGVVVPDSGTGRWHLVNAKPKSTSKTWGCAGSAFFGVLDGSNPPTISFSAGTFQSNANDSAIVSVRLEDFNAGDVLSSLKVLCTSSGTPGSTTITAYVCTPGDSSNTMTTLGTTTISQPVSTVTTITFGTPYTITAGDSVQVVIDYGGGTGTWTISNARLFGTRSYITE